MKRTSAVCLILGLACLPGIAQEKRNAFSVFGGMTEVLSYGSDSDYVLGENDFPVTPAHSALSAGLSFMHQFSGLLGVEVDGRFAPASRVTLTDPSDGDTVEADTLQHATVTLNALLFLGRGGFRPYLVLGAGADILVAPRDQTLTSSLGYEVSFLAPEKKAEPAANAGLGLILGLGARLGLRLDVRYILLPETGDHPLVHNISAVAGLVLRLF